MGLEIEQQHRETMVAQNLGAPRQRSRLVHAPCIKTTAPPPPGRRAESHQPRTSAPEPERSVIVSASERTSGGEPISVLAGRDRRKPTAITEPHRPIASAPIKRSSPGINCGPHIVYNKSARRRDTLDSLMPCK
jgi:hypothetical protein